MDVTQRNLQVQSKILIKLLEHQIYQSEQKNSQKSMFSTLKCKEAKNSYEGNPTEFAGSTQNLKKIIGAPNLPIRTKIFPKTVCLVP
jgi:hypothetical protein